MGGAVLLNVLVFSLVGLSIRQSYVQYQERAEITTRNLTQMLESQIASTINTDDVALFAVIDEYKRQRAAGGVDGQALNAHIERVRSRQPGIDALRITDAQGVLVYGSDVIPGAQTSLADRPHFLRLRDDPQAGLVMSRPQVSRANQKPVIVFARRIDQPNGSFGGMAFAAISMEHLSRTFFALNVGRRGVVALRDEELGIVVRRPDLWGIVSTTGNKSVARKFRDRVAAGHTTGTFTVQAGSDNIERAYSYRKVGAYPLYLSVGLASEDYLAEWRHEATQQAALAAFFTLITLSAAWLIYRIWKRQAILVEALARQEAKFRNLVETTSDWIWEIDENGVYTYASPRVRTMLGFDAAEVIGKTPFDLMPEDEAKRIAAAFGLIAAAREPLIHLENTCLHKDGHLVVVETSGVPIIDADGRFRGYHGIDRDITKRKRADAELKRSNTELEQFSYGISHDMRQPLRMVSSYLQLLEMKLADRLDDEQREYFNFAIDGAKRMDAMMLGLLDYSRVGRKGEPPAWIESRAVLDEALLFLRPAIAEAQAMVRVEGDWPRIFASPDEMLRLIQNLIGNALKFRVAGRTPEITVSSEIVGKQWLLSVADNGVGILPDQIFRLFQVFQRLQSRAAYEGTGIGLALCRKIAEHHGGTIWAESAGEGRGSTFRLRMPMRFGSAGVPPPAHDTGGASALQAAP